MLPQNAAPMSAPELLLRSKIALPLIRSEVIPRPRLTRTLARLQPGQLLLLTAPAGFGKTTLIAPWARAQQAAWLTLDEPDNDPQRFWRYLLAALRQADGRAGATLPDYELHIPTTDWETLLTFLINSYSTPARAADPILLVLDDYHLIQHSQIHQTLSYLLYHMPPGLRVTMLTRADPPLALARLRVQDQLLELRAADLQFTQEEMELFFARVLDEPLPPAALTALTRRIEGWAAGLHLAALSLKELAAAERPAFIAAFNGAQRYVLHYLLEEVLQRQPAAVQSFLLETAVLPHLSAGLCAAVTGQANAEQVLAALAAQSLFILPLDDQQKGYRYHPLFAGALQSYLQQTNPERVDEIRRSAADWYAARGIDYHVAPALIDHCESLTEREHEILILISKGCTNQQIADQLFISIGTVKGHVNHLLGKLNAQNRTEAVIHGQRLGLLEI